MGRVAKALGKPFFPWQQYVSDVAGEVLPDGSNAYDKVVVFVQRRAGKTVIIEPLTAYRCGQATAHQMWMTAQKRDNAVKRWKDSSAALERALGKDKVKRKISHSFEEMVWPATGSKFLPFAPDEDTMHGEDPDTVIVDELWAQTLEDQRKIQAGYKPAWSVKSGQEWLLSAAGTLRSEWMKAERKAGRAAVEAGLRSGTAYFEFCVPEVWEGTSTRELPNDVLLQLVLANHPRRDHGLRLTFLESELENPDGGGRDEFLRAYGGLDTDAEHSKMVVDSGRIASARSDAKIPQTARVSLGIAVDPDSREATVSAAWRGPDGVALTEVIQSAPGAAWLAPRVLEICRQQGDLIANVVVNNVGLARDAADQIEAAGIELLRLSQMDYQAACTRWRAGVADVVPGSQPTIRHDGAPALLAALRVAGTRQLMSGAVWATVSDPISALEANTVAVWGADHMPEPAEKKYTWSAF